MIDRVHLSFSRICQTFDVSVVFNHLINLISSFFSWYIRSISIQISSIQQTSDSFRLIFDLINIEIDDVLTFVSKAESVNDALNVLLFLANVSLSTRRVQLEICCHDFEIVEMNAMRLKTEVNLFVYLFDDVTFRLVSHRIGLFGTKTLAFSSNSTKKPVFSFLRFYQILNLFGLDLLTKVYEQSGNLRLLGNGVRKILLWKSLIYQISN